MAELSLSVIIPTYGRSQDLVGLLASVDPAKAGHEVIVVDDCSPDPSQFDGLKAANPLVRFLHLAVNGGPGQARNAGAREAKGDILLFLDSDTELVAGGIERLVEFFAANPEVNMVSGWDSPVPLNGGFFSRFKALSMVVGAPDHDADVSFLPGRCFAVRRWVMLESGGFDVSYKGADVEDFELGYRLRRGYGVIRYLTGFRVRHRYPSLQRQYQLYVRRIRMWMDLRASAGAFDDSFGTSGNDAVIQILSAVWPFVLVLGLAFGTLWPGLFALVAAVWINRKFMALCLKEEGLWFAARAVLCQSYLATAILGGAAVAVLQKPECLTPMVGERNTRMARKFLRLIDHAQVYVRALLSNGPNYLILFITGRCNLRCAHCFYLEEIEHADKKRELTLDEIGRMARNSPILYHITFTGGETFIRTDIADIVKEFYVHAHTRSVTLTTNGTYPERVAEQVEAIAKACPNMIVRVPLSLDGTEAVHDKSRGLDGTFKKVMKCYELLRAVADAHTNVKLDITSVLTQSNTSDIHALVGFVKTNMVVDNHAINFPRGNVKEREALLPSEAAYKEIVEGSSAGRKRAHYRFPLFSRVLIFLRDLVENAIKYVQRTGRMPFICEAGTRLIEINEYGELFPCEVLDSLIRDGQTLKPASFQQAWMGNVRDHDYDLRKVLATPQARAVTDFIRTGGCACTFECAIGASFVFKPTNVVRFALDRDMGKGG